MIYNPNKFNLENLYFSFIGIAGLIILAVLVIYLPPTGIKYNFQKPLILLIFIIICIMGMVAAISPTNCMGLLKIKKHIQVDNSVDKESDEKEFRGHHPECDNFKNHTYTLMGKKYCAGCSGLFTGALIAVIVIIIYYFHGIPVFNPYLIFVIGFLFVLTCLLQSFLLNINSNTGKFIFNLILVVGAFLMLIGITEITGSIFVQIYFLLLVFIWIMARISNSEKKHGDICEKCDKRSYCSYR